MSYVKKSLFIILNQEKPELIISEQEPRDTFVVEGKVFEHKNLENGLDGLPDLLLNPNYHEDLHIVGAGYFVFFNEQDLNKEQRDFFARLSELKYVEFLLRDRVMFYFAEGFNDWNFESLREIDDEEFSKSTKVKIYSNNETYALSFTNVPLREDEWKTFDELNLKVTKI